MVGRAPARCRGVLGVALRQADEEGRGSCRVKCSNLAVVGFRCLKDLGILIDDYGVHTHTHMYIYTHIAFVCFCLLLHNIYMFCMLACDIYYILKIFFHSGIII